MTRSDRDRLADIAQAITSIEGYVGDLAVADIEDDAHRDATLYNLLVIGEAAKGIGGHLQASEPDVPWKKIAGMRDVLAHHYFVVDRGTIETTIRRDLPPLRQAVQRLLDGSGE